MNSIIDYLEHWAAGIPDKHFCSSSILRYVTDSYPYFGFHDRTRHLGRSLVRHLGIRRGDRALLAYPRLEVIVAFLACARIGIIPVPVYAPIEELLRGLTKLAFVARDCQATVALTTAAFYRSYRLLIAQRQIPSLSPSTPFLYAARSGHDGRR